MPTTSPPPMEPRIDRARIAAVPKIDLHLHQESARCLDRIYARRENRPPYDWSSWRRRVAATVPPGPDRLALVGSVQPVPLADDDDELFVARFAELLRHAGAAGAYYVEIRCGGDTVLRERFMELFRQAEDEARSKYPHLRAEALAVLQMTRPTDEVNRLADGCVRLASDGLAGVDFLYSPYNSEADWTSIYRLADRLASAGLGVTAHAGETSTANIAAAARVPGLTRIGHGIHAAADSRLIDLLLDRDITLECALTCNAFFGACPSLAEHPLPRLLDAGVQVTLATDNPIQLDTDIGTEYAVAASLGVSERQLFSISHTAVRAAFTTPDRRAGLLRDIANAGAIALPNS